MLDGNVLQHPPDRTVADDGDNRQIVGERVDFVTEHADRLRFVKLARRRHDRERGREAREPGTLEHQYQDKTAVVVPGDLLAGGEGGTPGCAVTKCDQHTPR